MGHQRSAPGKFSLGGRAAAFLTSLLPLRTLCFRRGGRDANRSYRRRAQKVFSTYQQSRGLLVDGCQRHRCSITSKRTIQQTRLGAAPRTSGPVPTTRQIVRGRLIPCLTCDGSGRPKRSIRMRPNRISADSLRSPRNEEGLSRFQLSPCSIWSSQPESNQRPLQCHICALSVKPTENLGIFP
jgi:hypothetical protein